MSDSTQEFRALLQQGLVIPAHPLALTEDLRLDERRQNALTRYYCEAGSGGVAVGVHTTQFGIRDSNVGLFEPVLELAMEEVRAFEHRTGKRLAKIGGICGDTRQACAEAATIRKLGYDGGLLSLAALADASNAELIEHCRAVGDNVPIIGFYLQPAVGGRPLNAAFWEKFVEIESVVAIKVASFDRYQTMEVLRTVAHSGRGDEIALYTGNDDNIVADLLTEFRFGDRTAHFVGGLLGQWAVWTSRAVELLQTVQEVKRNRARLDTVLARGAEITDANAAIFDARHEFRGCIPGIHEVLRRQGLLANRACLDPHESLSSGQLEEIDRVYAAYPLLNDDQFVAEHLDRWLS
ncbi:dihydrodipicolinate synthase family protein [Tunturiibacter gelidoferens]|uniref:Dihydrodipicolinate synthase/N-acetylneuraminate lyase n=1 Tax=Tunturiibacter gelidiferens TaxID=3069689 RepID=A0A9X0QHN6_9BACT|nr:dihydrodipicolinate synthase family protein [Edaphobacter lichenicola]MBB5330687.1 dihydrodipicolinate synthase/N-acetylneuraminate lyase [Edaphobacter lichenicola]